MSDIRIVQIFLLVVAALYDISWWRCMDERL